MSRIVSRDGWNDSLGQQPFRQLLTRRQRSENWNTTQFVQTRSGKFCITATNFDNDDFRHEKFKIVPPLFPPFQRALLICREPQIFACARDKITWNRCFKIESWFQLLRLTIRHHGQIVRTMFSRI